MQNPIDGQFILGLGLPWRNCIKGYILCVIKVRATFEAAPVNKFLWSRILENPSKLSKIFAVKHRKCHYEKMYVIKNFKEMFFKNRTRDRAVKPLKPIERFERPIGAWPFTEKNTAPVPFKIWYHWCHCIVR